MLIPYLLSIQYLLLYSIGVAIAFIAIRNARKEDEVKDKNTMLQKARMPKTALGWFTKCWRQYANFDGRAQRKEYWFFVLFTSLIGLGLSLIGTLFVLKDIDTIAETIVNDDIILREDGFFALTIDTLEVLMPYYILVDIYMLVSLIPSMAVLVRRLHDSGKSGLWLLICYSLVVISTFQPVIAIVAGIANLIVFVFTLLDSEPTANEWGENPKANEQDKNPKI